MKESFVVSGFLTRRRRLLGLVLTAGVGALMAAEPVPTPPALPALPQLPAPPAAPAPAPTPAPVPAAPAAGASTNAAVAPPRLPPSLNTGAFTNLPMELRLKALRTAGLTNEAERLSGLLTNVPAAGGTNAAGGEEILPVNTIRLQTASLNAVLDVYAILVQRTILRPSSLPDVTITLRNTTPLTIAEAVRAIEAVLSMNQITLIPVGEKFVKVVPQTVAFQEAKRPSSLDEVHEMEDLGPFVTVVRQMTNAKPSEVVQAIQPFAKMQGGIVPIDSSGILVLRDYADNVKRMMELLDKIDVTVPLEVEPVVIPIKYALAGDIAQVLGQLTSGTVASTGTGAGSTRGLSRPATTTGRTSPFGTVPGQPGFNPTTPGGTTGITPTTSPGSAQSAFQDRLRSIVARAAGTGDFQILGQAKIIADERINALLVFADKRDRDMITNIISKLDVVLAQVLIEALIVEVGLNDNEEYGISYLQRAVSKGKFTGAGAINNAQGNPFLDPNTIGGVGTNLAGGFTYFARIGDLDIAAKAAASDGRISVLSRPRIQTSHAVEASLFVGETRPYPTGSAYGGYYGAYSTIQQLQIGIELSVLPLINPDGLVVMEIRQRIQNVGEPVRIENVGEVPTTIDRTANAKVAVRDGDTIILGGFISADHSRSKSGVPLLKDIPGLGALFRSSSTKRNRKELIVFIRPTVLENPEAAAKLAANERAKISPVNAVEKQFERDERERTRQLLDEMQRDEKKKKGARTSGEPAANNLQSFPPM
ncbi:MAG: hypothetical protein N3J91_11720 [Verrucomicrobiae bacterium]|nr:hypothetical protein [Verrucomicrobiae bacterium]